MPVEALMSKNLLRGLPNGIFRVSFTVYALYTSLTATTIFPQLL